MPDIGCGRLGTYLDPVDKKGARRSGASCGWWRRRDDRAQGICRGDGERGPGAETEALMALMALNQTRRGSDPPCEPIHHRAHHGGQAGCGAWEINGRKSGRVFAFDTEPLWITLRDTGLALSPGGYPGHLLPGQRKQRRRWIPARGRGISSLGAGAGEITSADRPGAAAKSGGERLLMNEFEARFFPAG